MKKPSLRRVAAQSLSILALSFSLAGSNLAVAGDHHDRHSLFRHPTPHFHVVPSGPRALSRIYSLYQARWWQWATSFPVDAHPLLDTADGSAGQTGPVWFLGGVFGSGPVERTLTIPAGKALFFPILNQGYFLTDDTDTEEASREFTNAVLDHVVTSFAEIDGRPVYHLDRFRTESALFNVGPLPENNLFGLDQGTVIPTVDEGIYLLLLPLSPGEHTIHFGGEVFVPEDVLGFEYGFTQDVTYHIIVEPRRRR